MGAPGIQLISPSSLFALPVAGWQMTGTGSFTFVDVDSSATVRANGVFNSTYDNYMIVGHVTTTAATSILFFRLGTDQNAYYTQSKVSSGTTTTASLSSTSFGFRIATAVQSPRRTGFVVHLYRPFLAVPTTFRSVVSSNGRLEDYAGIHEYATSFTAFTILASAAMTSGEISVYGLVK